MTEQKPLALRLDFRSGLPIYIQIVQQIESQIAAKMLNPGALLPTVRALAQDLRINFNTVARAYRMLDEARIISTQQGRGTYITEIPPPEVTERLRQETLEALARGYINEAKIIQDVMNGTRNFLGQKHTMKHLRAGELALTQLAERNAWETWDEKLERKQMADHAIDEAERLLKEHVVPPLEPQQEKELDKIMAAAEAEMVEKK